ncbi:MAG TPA: tetratricopeptide repeat protein, partial [Planctomycetaceae bacterium]|nr:tetratricopeptide repeat protein [Planctomycetaceae bacterium]
MRLNVGTSQQAVPPATGFSMPHRELRLLASVLLFVSGCASQNFLAGLSPRAQKDAGPATEPGRGQPPTSASNSQTKDRARIDARGASIDAAFDRNVKELLEIAARNQRAGNLAAARSNYEQVLRISPNQLTANYQLAVLDDNEGRFADSGRHYAVLLNQEPHNADFSASLGWSLILQGRYDEAERVLRDALKSQPTHKTALNNLGWAYGMRGEFDQALALFRAAGSEVEAQRALAELKQHFRPGTADIAVRDSSEFQRSNANNSAPPSAGRENLATRDFSAPTPWNRPAGAESQGSKSRTQLASSSDPAEQPRGGQQSRDTNAIDPTDRGWFNGRFAELDAYASSSPSQANRARQADTQGFSEAADVGGATGPPGFTAAGAQLASR